jgi:D-alanyl-D-alanine carboxypeptidase
MKAKLLGLNDYDLETPTGCLLTVYIAAKDMANLSRRYIEDHPGARFASTTEFELMESGRNRNTLLQYWVDGLKTGT